MNERIRELADATADLMPSGVYSVKYESGKKGVEFTEDALEKFAELIVRECIDIVSPYAIRMENFDGGHPIADLKKHFGVEP